MNAADLRFGDVVANADRDEVLFVADVDGQQVKGVWIDEGACGSEGWISWHMDFWQRIDGAT